MLSALAVASMRASANTSTSPLPTLTLVVTAEASLLEWAPMKASTVPLTVALTSMKLRSAISAPPKLSPTGVVFISASAVMSTWFAETTTPSPT